jgi:hypothetical protein
MKTILALVGAGFIVFMAYGAGTMRYECVSPAAQPIGDGSGRWFYMCLGPEPRDSQKVSMAEAYRRFGPPPQQTVDGLLRGPTARVSPAQPVAP